MSQDRTVAGTVLDVAAWSDTNSYAEEVAAGSFAAILGARRKDVAREQRNTVESEAIVLDTAEMEVNIPSAAVLEVPLPDIVDWKKCKLNTAAAGQMSGLGEELGSDTAVESVRK